MIPFRKSGHILALVLLKIRVYLGLRKRNMPHVTVVARALYASRGASNTGVTIIASQPVARITQPAQLHDCTKATAIQANDVCIYHFFFFKETATATTREQRKGL